MRRARPAILRLLPGLIAWGILSAPAAAQAPRRTQDPPAQTEQFARLVGDWEMTVWSREQTGEWEDPHTAYWSWRVIMGGHAVQDFWYGPGPEPAVWSHGTNVRIYDPGSGEWRVRWTAADDRSFMELTGAMEPGDSLRLYTTHESGAPIRITFHDVTADRFLWRLEARGADGSWSLFSRMEGNRIPPDELPMTLGPEETVNPMDERPGGTGDARQIELEIVVDGTPDEVIADWLDEATVDRFFGVASRIEPRVGGAYEIRFLPGDDAASRANATLGARVLALDPGAHLAFEWGLPPWAEEPARSAPRTRVDVRVEPAWDPATGDALENRTVVNLRHTGYGHGPEWDAVRRFFLWSWFNVLSRYRAVAGS